MFDFEKLEVYTKSKIFTHKVICFLSNCKTDKVVSDQLRRAALSIILNIAEGSSRFSNKDRKNFLVIARGSAFECAAIFEFLKDNNYIELDTYHNYYKDLEEISKMLFALIKKLEN